jgi:hypothetical protein
MVFETPRRDNRSTTIYRGEYLEWLRGLKYERFLFSSRPKTTTRLCEDSATEMALFSARMLSRIRPKHSAVFPASFIARTCPVVLGGDFRVSAYE